MIRPETSVRTPIATCGSGGLNVDLVAGYEFMRASSVHFR
jgi:hypothetical protein